MKKKENKIENSNIEMGNLFKIILIILVFFGVFYIITYYIQKNDKQELNEYENNSIPIIQYDEILIGNMLEQREEEYYVLILNETDYNDRYEEYLGRYSNNNRFYYSYINNGLNKKYISETSNLNTSDLNEFKVKENTLLKINSKKIVESYEGNSKIMEVFIELNK